MYAEAWPSPDAPTYAPARARGHAWVVFIGGHLLLAAAVHSMPVLSTMHAWLTALVALWVALRCAPAVITQAAAYVTGSDVFWRMTHAVFPWEGAQYLVAAMCLIGVLRLGRSARWQPLPLLYFLMLLPSISVILANPRYPNGAIMQMVSFNLSGPLALATTALFMSNVTLSRQETRTVLLTLITPLLAVAAVTILATYGAADLTFTDESNFATSGGFGPNQVSAVLGLGALSSLILAFDLELPLRRRVPAVGLVLLFAVQSALTFSRGGLYNFSIAAIPLVLYLSRSAATRRWAVIVIGGLALLGAGVVLPRLDRFTGGTLSVRFHDTNSAGRSGLMREDLRLWGEHPVWGLGPGGAKAARRSEYRVSHTEYTRLLSEHGVFGAIALLALAAICVTVVARAQTGRARAIRSALLLWSVASMLHVGMRVAATGFVFGLACAGALAAERVIRVGSDPDATTG